MVWTFMMIVLPAMMLKGLHWGYTRFYLGWFLKPVDLFTEDDKYRYFHRPNETPTKPVIVQEVKQEEKQEDAVDKCPVGPVLRLFGIGKKKPDGHPSLSNKDILREAANSSAASAKMQWLQ